MKKVIIIVIVVFMVIAVSVYLRYGVSREQDKFILSGTVEVTEISVGFKIPGKVQKLFTDEGRAVKKGDRLAVLDTAEYESLINQSSASVQNAEAQFDKANKDLERYTLLHKDGVIANQQMESARTAYDVAGSQLRLYQAAQRTAEVRLRDTVILSPINGTVLRKIIDEGETVGAGATVFLLGDLEKPWVKVYVKEDRLGQVKLGQKAEVSVDSFPKKRYEGVVSYLSSEAEFTPKNVQTREERIKLVFGVKVSVKNQNNELKPGMPADVVLISK